MSITEDQFRKTLGLFPTGVTVVTTPRGEGQDVGITISSFTSVSLNPPQILFCVSKYSKSFSAFKDSLYFAVNILNAGQSQAADDFAKHMPPKDAMLQAYRHEETGCLLLSGALGHVVCERGAIYEGGDHHIILGTVIAVGADAHALPLVRQKGQYLTIQSLSIEPLQQVCSL